MTKVNEFFKEYEKEVADYVNYPHLKKDKAKKDIEKYSKIIEETGGNYDPLIFRGLAYFWASLGVDNNHFDSAIEDLTQAGEIARRQAVSYLQAIAVFYIGECYDRKGSSEEAVKFYTKAIEFEPTFMEAYRSRAGCYHFLSIEMLENEKKDEAKWSKLREEAQND